MVNLGISADDLNKAAAGDKTAGRKPDKKLSTITKRGPKKGSKVPAKYSLKVQGRRHEWTGRGRMPLAFKNYIESGGSLESCLIKKSK